MKSFGLALALVVLSSGSHDPAKEANEYPFIVSIHRNTPRRNYICAGSLIAASWVLTTAHCLPKFACRIRYGDMMTINNSTYSKILQRIHHINSRSVYIIKASDRLTPKSNNIGLALVESISGIQFGQLSALEYPTMVGYGVTYFEFGFLPVFKARIYETNKDRLKGIFNNKKNREKIKPSYGDDGAIAIPIDTKVLHTAEGVVISCPDKTRPGPNICVASKCFDFNLDDPRRALIAPDYGAPLIYDKRVIGFTSEIEYHYSRFTPISPYLDWIQKQMREIKI